MKNLVRAAAVLVALTVAHQSAQAHTTGIGYVDNGDGSVTFYQQHWHGSIGAPSGALVISTGPSGVGTYNFTTRLNNIATPTLDGFASYTGYNINSYNDWQTVTINGLVSGNYGVTGSTISAVSSPGGSGLLQLSVNVSSSVVPEPASAGLFAVGVLGMCSVVNRRRRA